MRGTYHFLTTPNEEFVGGCIRDVWHPFVSSKISLFLLGACSATEFLLNLICCVDGFYFKMMFGVWEDVHDLKRRITSSLLATYLEALGTFCGLGSVLTLCPLALSVNTLISSLSWRVCRVLLSYFSR